MLPIVDYGSIALVVPMITAVGSPVSKNGSSGFEVYMSGIAEPILIEFDSPEEALEEREELIGIIAQYHYIKELGPDFDLDSLLDKSINDDDIN
ncbi:MAG: hypothetical protein FWH53_06375 [Leptospirales bacterium]|nr:hypothetical protein [Leptospirales bacterium]